MKKKKEKKMLVVCKSYCPEPTQKQGKHQVNTGSFPGPAAPREGTGSKAPTPEPLQVLDNERGLAATAELHYLLVM